MDRGRSGYITFPLPYIDTRAGRLGRGPEPIVWPASYIEDLSPKGSESSGYITLSPSYMDWPLRSGRRGDIHIDGP